MSTIKVKNKIYYSIGEVSKISNISRKALRFYDQIGVISPDFIQDENNYRYYSKKSLLLIPVIKYYKQTGFTLEEMKTLLDEGSYSLFNMHFKNKIDELKKLEKELSLKITSLCDWNDLIEEANLVVENNMTEISVKYISESEMIFLDQEFNYDYKESIINIEFTNFIEKNNNSITGPVIIKYPSYIDKMTGKSKKMRVIQKAIKPLKKENLYLFGGAMFISCYHVGNHNMINTTYDKIKKWIEEHNYECCDECYERYVTDYWTTNNEIKYVTEILIKIK